MKRVLVIAPHQDDEVIGCGGLIQKVVADGGEVRVLFGTYVTGTYRKLNKDGEYETYTGTDRMRETVNALNTLGAKVFGDPIAPSSKHHALDTVPLSELALAIEAAVSSFKPDLILIPAVSQNQDHEALNRAARIVMRPQFYNGTVMEYEIMGEFDFQPNFYVPLTGEEMDKKILAWECYKTQDSGPLHMVSTEGIVARAKLRGREVYAPYAEGYRIVRMVYV